MTFSEDAKLKDARLNLRMQGYPWESCSSLLCGLTVRLPGGPQLRAQEAPTKPPRFSEEAPERARRPLGSPQDCRRGPWDDRGGSPKAPEKTPDSVEWTSRGCHSTLFVAWLFIPNVSPGSPLHHPPPSAIPPPSSLPLPFSASSSFLFFLSFSLRELTVSTFHDLLGENSLGCSRGLVPLQRPLP